MRLSYRVAALVEGKDPVIQILDTHLNLGHSERAQPG